MIKTVLSIDEFAGLPFSKQIHLTCLLYLKRQHISPFKNGKLDPAYFQARGCLYKLPRQNIKNIYFLLLSSNAPISLYELDKKANEFVRASQIACEEEKQEELTQEKEYEIDLQSFLSS